MFHQLDKWDERQLSEHLSHHEVRCRCKYPQCNHTLIHSTIIEAFETLRQKSGNHSLSITSGYRCQMHNDDVGGTPKSMHKRGLALDIVIPPHIDQEEFYKMASESGFTFCLLYADQNFVHCQITLKKKFEHYLSSEV